MPEDDEPGPGGAGLGRTLALSDGVFAIAMTLLAFQVQPPDAPAIAKYGLAGALGRMGTPYFVFFLSFSVIGVIWLAHHRLFSLVSRADELLMTLNLVFLMTVAALPFPSAVLGRYADHRASVILYASAMAVAGVLLCALTLVARGRGLLSPASTPADVRQALWRSGTMATVFALSIPIAVLAPGVAPFTWLTLIPVRVVSGRARRRVAAA